jgi:hypothetical protein
VRKGGGRQVVVFILRAWEKGFLRSSSTSLSDRTALLSFYLGNQQILWTLGNTITDLLPIPLFSWLRLAEVVPCIRPCIADLYEHANQNRNVANSQQKGAHVGPSNEGERAREPLAAHPALSRLSPSLILLQSYDDATLSRASLGASWVRLTLGSPASTADG